jgi:hypothetical protein
MPTGFDVETGSNLSKKLLSLAPVLLKYLATEREQRARGPENPLLSPEIETHFLTYNQKLIGSEIRAMVNYLRRNKSPIGSNAGGYFLAVSRQELDFTVNHLQERISAINSAVQGLIHSFDDKDQMLL